MWSPENAGVGGNGASVRLGLFAGNGGAGVRRPRKKERVGVCRAGLRKTFFGRKRIGDAGFSGLRIRSENQA